MRHLTTILFSVAVMLAAISVTGAAEKPTTKVISLTVHPAQVPRPAMKYSLLPELLTQTSGNAAPLYLKAALVLAQTEADKDTWEQVSKYLDMPVDELPCDRVRKMLEPFDSAVGEVVLASRRESCAWDMPFRDTEDVFGILLPELQLARNFGRLIALRARLQMAEGRCDEALMSLRVGFALSRHVAEQPVLISGLVGLAVSGIMADQLEALIQLPDAPNLYWSIAALPDPFIDLRDAMRLEGSTVYLFFPQLQAAKRGNHTPEQWQMLFGAFISKFYSLVEEYVEEKPTAKPKPEELLKKVYPTARRELVARGRSEKAVDAMSRAQAVLLHVAETWDELRDEMFKWFHVPYWKAQDRVRESEEWVATEGKRLEVAPLASVLAPAVGSCYFAVAKSERRLAALRCIEAVRLHAATHDGKLPAKLSDITEVPIPANPVTGKPFGYRLEGDTAILDADGGKDQRQYRLKLAK